MIKWRANFTLYPGNSDLERTAQRRPRKARTSRSLVRWEAVGNAIAAVCRRVADRFDGGRPC